MGLLSDKTRMELNCESTRKSSRRFLTDNSVNTNITKDVFVSQAHKDIFVRGLDIFVQYMQSESNMNHPFTRQ